MNPILSAPSALLLGDGNLGNRLVMVLTLSIAGAIGVTCLVAFLIKRATPSNPRTHNSEPAGFVQNR
jgi:hypothetical protein